MPILEQNVSAPERQHAQTVTQNLQRHLIAVLVDMRLQTFLKFEVLLLTAT